MEKNSSALKIILISVFCVVAVLVGWYYVNSQINKKLAESISRSRDARMTQDLKQMEKALMEYTDTHNGKFPLTLNELVPANLVALPIEKSTNQPYAYSRDTEKSFSICPKVISPDMAKYFFVSGKKCLTGQSEVSN